MVGNKRVRFHQILSMTFSIVLSIGVFAQGIPPEEGEEIEAVEATHVFGFGALTSAVCSPTESRFASASVNGKLLLWDMETGEILWTVQAHITRIMIMQFSPDGTMIATGSLDGTARLWDVESGARLFTFAEENEFENEVYDLEFFRDGTRIAVGTWITLPHPFRPDSVVFESVVSLWDVSTGEWVDEIYGAGTMLALSPDGAFIAIEDTFTYIETEEGRTRYVPIVVWDLETFEPVATYLVPILIGLTELSYSPSGERLVMTDMRGRVYVIETATGEIVHVLQDFESDILSDIIIYNRPYSMFSPDGQQILAGGIESGPPFYFTLDAAVWVAETGEKQQTFQIQEWIGDEFPVRLWRGDVISVDYSWDGSKVLTASDEQVIRLWDTQTGEELRRYTGHTNQVQSVSFSHDGHRAVISRQYDRLTVCDVRSGETIARVDNPVSYQIRDAAFSADGSELFVYSGGRLIALDSATGERLRTYDPAEHGHESVIVNSFDLSPDGRYLAVGASGNRVIVWDAETAEIVHIFQEETFRVEDVRFSPSGDRVLSIHYPDLAVLWDVNTKERLMDYPPVLDRPIWDAAFSPDGLQLLIAGYDEIPDPEGLGYIEVEAVTLWDAQSGAFLDSFPGACSVVTAGTARDGGYFITGNYRGDISMKSIETGETVRTFAGHTEFIESLAVSPDGSMLLSGSRDGTARLFSLPPHLSTVEEWSLY